MAQEQYRTVDILEKDTGSINFLYRTALGRCVLKVLINRVFSKILGAILDTRLSKCFIKRFIKGSGIRMEDYVQEQYRSFNAFFTRHIRPECRPITMDRDALVSPCDGKLTVYPITEDAVFRIKNSSYDIESLLEAPELAKEFAGGTCLVFRLCPDDYHRYHYSHWGKVVRTKKIRGVLHTVRPVAFDRYPIFKKNSREYALLDTEDFGPVIQMEVGALFVGRIKNHPVESFSRGDERGMFEFGGSTIVMLYSKDAIELDPVFLENTRNKKETVVTMGMQLGKAK